MPEKGLQEIVGRARKLNANEEDLYWGGGDGLSALNPRNEAAALSWILANKEDIIEDLQISEDDLYQLMDGYHTGSSKVVEQCGEDSPEVALLRWCQDGGLQTTLRPARFEGGLRGLGAAGPSFLKPGACVMEVPASLLITYETAKTSDLGVALSRLPHLDDELLAVLWTLVDCRDEESPWRAFWEALPRCLYTGLSATDAEMTLLKDTPAYEEVEAARDHVQQQYLALRPIMDVLLTAYPQLLQPDMFTEECYLWAVQLWYAYAIQVKFPDGVVRPTLVPYLSLMNHSPYPHVTHYSTVDPATDMLQVCTFRACHPDQQCFMSYGPLPNSKLMTYYGFALDDNPFDTIALTLDEPPEEDRKAALNRYGLVLEHHLSAHHPLPPSLLSSLRVLLADDGEVEQMKQGTANPQVTLGPGTEQQMLEVLSSLVGSLWPQPTEVGGGATVQEKGHGGEEQQLLRASIAVYRKSLVAICQRVTSECEVLAS